MYFESMASSKNLPRILKNVAAVSRLSDPAWCCGPIRGTCAIKFGVQFLDEGTSGRKKNALEGRRRLLATHPSATCSSSSSTAIRVVRISCGRQGLNEIERLTLMSQMHGNQIRRSSKNSASVGGKGAHETILRRYPKSYPL